MYYHLFVQTFEKCLSKQKSSKVSFEHDAICPSEHDAMCHGLWTTTKSLILRSPNSNPNPK